MSKFIQLASVSVLFAGMAFLYYLHFSSSNTVYVDSSRLINSYQGMLDARSDFQKKASLWRANVDTLTVEVQQSITNYEKESGIMSSKEKELSKELIRSKQKQLAEYQRAMNEKAAQEDQQLTGQVLEQVNAYIKKYGKDHNYHIILAATEYGNIAYAEDGVDITEEVLKGLNQEYAGL